MSVVTGDARQTASVLSSKVVRSEMQEQNQAMKTSLEKYYGVAIDFINARRNISRSVYDTIIKITNEISEAEGLDDRRLESIAKKVSTWFNPVTLTDMKYYIVLEVRIGKDTYVLKRMNLMPSKNANDTLITKFNSPYIIEALMTFRNGTEEWIVMEYVGPKIPDYHGDFTKEEIKMLVHNCFLGLDTIHENGYYHNDLFARNIVYARNDKGKTVGFKIIDFGRSEMKDKSQMEPLELYYEINGVLEVVNEYFKHRVNMRPKDVGYMEVVDASSGEVIRTEFGPIAFMEEDSILADFFMTASGRVNKPATSITDLLKHQYLARASADQSVFGEKKWTAVKKTPTGISDD